jgi:predicted enzyme related to lactoylglutathione lyase
MAGDVVWTVLMSRHADEAKRFYADILGWSFEPFEGTADRCWSARNAEGAVVAAIVDTSTVDFPSAPELWVPCFAVDDLDGLLSEAEARGGTVLRPPLVVPNFGRVAVLRQPGGGIVGWLTPAAAEPLS